MNERRLQPQMSTKEPSQPPTGEAVSEKPEGNFFAKNEVFWCHYAKDGSLTVRESKSGTACINLETGLIEINPDFFLNKPGSTEAKVTFGIAHEIEHFRELRELLQEKKDVRTGQDGKEVWRAHQKK